MPGPLDHLKEQYGEPVIVRLRGGREFSGELEGCDSHMNLVLKNAREIGTEEKSGSLVIRGDNIVYISP